MFLFPATRGHLPFLVECLLESWTKWSEIAVFRNSEWACLTGGTNARFYLFMTCALWALFFTFLLFFSFCEDCDVKKRSFLRFTSSQDAVLCTRSRETEEFCQRDYTAFMKCAISRVGQQLFFELLIWSIPLWLAFQQTSINTGVYRFPFSLSYVWFYLDHSSYYCSEHGSKSCRDEVGKRTRECLPMVYWKSWQCFLFLISLILQFARLDNEAKADYAAEISADAQV